MAGDKKNPFMTLQEKADAARRERKSKLSSWLSGAGESGRDWHKTAHLMQQDLERIISAADVEGALTSTGLGMLVAKTRSSSLPKTSSSLCHANSGRSGQSGWN